MVIALVVVGARISKPQIANDMMTENIEALTTDEGGIKISDCYFDGMNDSSPEFSIVCNSSTTTSMIYKCPTETRWIRRQSRGSCYD